MLLRQRYILIAGLLFTLGLLFLLNNFRLLKDVDFSLVLFLWPLILILFAIYVIFIGKKVTYFITGLNSIIIGLVLFSGIVVYGAKIPFLPKVETGRVSKVNPNINIQSESDRFYKKIDKANLIFKSERGEFYLRGTTNKLTEYEAKTTFGEYLYNSSEKDGVQTIDLRFDPERIPWRLTAEKNSLDLKLNPDTVWSIQYDLSSASLYADLGYYNVSSFKLILSGGSKATINIDESTIKDKLSMYIQSSTSGIDLRIASNIGIEIKSKALLSRQDLADLENKGNGIFQTKDFDKASKKIYIDSNINLSQLKIIRY